MYKISLIIPVYNAEKKIETAISSIINQTMDLRHIEVIFVDDCSTDRSLDIIKKYCELYPNFKYFRLEENSGSASKPRNIGIRKATAEYIMFLDSDDALPENSINLLYTKAEEFECDIVRGYIKVISKNGEYIANRLNFEDYNKVTKHTLISKLIAKQSTTRDGIYKKSFLLTNNIQFNENIRMGEDTLFLSTCYSKNPNICYIDECVYHYYKWDEVNNTSVTQSYGTKELHDHLFVWKETQKILREINIDYYNLRLPVGLRSALESIVNFSDGKIPYEDFLELRKFLAKRNTIIPKMNLNSRIKEVVTNIIEDNYNDFIANTKKRLLISGYDLKFIKPIVPYFERFYEVKIDEWDGHEKHDERRSKELLEWADIIFCEWLLGNAVWYSNHKKENQILIVRVHRFEVFREFGHQINISNVDRFITVGVYYYESLINSFKIPREKVSLIPNYVDIKRFNNGKTENAKYNLAMIGILPARKRVDLGLDILEILLEKDPSYKLHIIGTRPEEVDWLWRKREERDYFEKIYKRIESSKRLKDSVIFAGWQDTAQYLSNIGFVLSLSDYSNPESFHLSPAEGMASGAIALLLNWPGVEYIYPSEFIHHNVSEIANKILEINDNNLFEEYSMRGKKFIEENYSIEKVMMYFNNLIFKVFLNKRN